jgi:thiamine kinase-like enzyme
MENQIQLLGNSGAEINIYLERGKPVLKKKFRNTSEVEFCVQMHRSKEYGRSPKIIRYDERSVYMEYIGGKVGSQIIKQAEADEMRCLIKGLRIFIEHNLSMSSFADISLTRINKLSLINKNIPEHLCYFKKYVDYAHEQIVEQKNLQTPIGRCHGDLTLANIILDRTNFYFIDYLDGYLKSPIVDIAKLIQEFIFGWSCRYDHYKYNLRCKYILNEIISYIDKSCIRLVDVKIETIITILRIIPYIKDRRTEKWVSKTLERLARGEDFIYWE